ncbi:MAG: VWA domain-containing protein [Alphaproteobacteria bacterium]|nr:VWA domain-containing protein [Alphaproteobacteria bacterium]
MSKLKAAEKRNLQRWRLSLGRYSDSQLGVGLGGGAAGMDAALEYLYRQEYQRRGLRQSGPKGPGSLDPSQLTAPDWLGKARKLFPQSVYETLQGHALERYGMKELLNDPKTLASLEPNRDLLKALMTFRDKASPAVAEMVRQIARQVIEDILRRLKPRVTTAFSGQRNRFRRSSLKSLANFDWRGTLRENLKNFDAERNRIIADRLRFYSRQTRQLPWTVILCVDQSGSMLNSVIHSAVMAAILSGLPGVTVKLVVFDTSIVDLSDRLDDPVEVLLSVQLGGGTYIGRAMNYCEGLVDNPSRTVFVLVSDFCEGAPPREMLAATARLNEARVKLIGLAALDDDAAPDYDRAMAERLSELGMEIGVMTPDRFAEWLAGIMQ